MIDLVAGYARGYSAEDLRPFLKSLRGTGYDGGILLFVDGGAVREAQKWGATVRPVPPLRMKVHSDRFLCLEEALRGVKCNGVLLTDTRDVYFQTNPAIALPAEGLNVFEEDASMTIGTCPYNSLWIQLGYGDEALRKMSKEAISCVGTVCGDYGSVTYYLRLLRQEVERIQPRTQKPQDQGAHNYLINDVLDATCWKNEDAEVYTVGYIKPFGRVRVVDGKVVNSRGRAPAVIHQWDRHPNLKQLIEGDTSER